MSTEQFASLPLYEAHRARANQHRPTDPATLATEVRRLASLGLRERDIERALQLGPGDVAAALREAP